MAFQEWLGFSYFIVLHLRFRIYSLERLRDVGDSLLDR